MTASSPLAGAMGGPRRDLGNWCHLEDVKLEPLTYGASLWMVAEVEQEVLRCVRDGGGCPGTLPF